MTTTHKVMSVHAWVGRETGTGHQYNKWVRQQLAAVAKAYLQEVCLQLGNLVLASGDLGLQAGLVLLHAPYLAVLVFQPRCHACLLHRQHLTLQHGLSVWLTAWIQ